MAGGTSLVIAWFPEGGNSVGRKDKGQKNVKKPKQDKAKKGSSKK
jgi:hypothetical protein